MALFRLPSSGPAALVPRGYGLLLRAGPSPVIELNRAVAVAMRDGPGAGLELIDAILARYNHTPRKCLAYQTPAEAFLNPLHFECESTPGSSPG